MADDPFEDEFGISIEEMGFDPRDIRSQEQYDELDETQKNIFANIRYESSLAPEERKKIAEKRKKKKEDERKRKEAMKATEDRRVAEERAMLCRDKMNVFIPLWEGFDQVSFSTLVDILQAGGLHVSTGVVRHVPPTPPPKATPDSYKVRGKTGVVLVGDFLFEYKGNHNFNQYDAVVIPGGEGVHRVLAGNRKFMSLVKGFAHRKKHVCGAEDVPGVLFLGLGLLEKRKTTGSERSEQEITNSVPAELGKSVTFCRGESVVVDEHIITSRSPADAAEFALTILSNLRGVSVMAEVAEKMKYEAHIEKVKQQTVVVKPKETPKKPGGKKTKEANTAKAEEKKQDEDEDANENGID